MESKELSFLKKNFKCEILYTDSKTRNLLSIKYVNFVLYFAKKPDLQNLLFDMIRYDKGEKDFFVLAFFTRLFGGINKIKSIDEGELNGNFLFHPLIFSSAIEYLKTGEYIEPNDIKKYIISGKIKLQGEKVSFHFGDFINLFFAIMIIIAIISSIVKSCS